MKVKRKSRARMAREDLAWAVRDFVTCKGLALTFRGDGTPMARRFFKESQESWARLQWHLNGGGAAR